MKFASIRTARTALIVAAIVAVCAFLVFRIDGADAQSACVQSLDGSGAVNGSWDSACLSENTPTAPTNPPSGTRFARFYTFTLTASADISIDLTSSTDTYMYLIEGIGANGTILHENDDAEDGSTSSRISESLQPGSYTIEATTYEVETAGDFTLTVSGIPDAPTPVPTSTSVAVDTPVPTATPYPGQDTPVPTPTFPPVITPTPTAVPVLPTRVPVHTPTPQPAKSAMVAAGPNHACALDQDGAISCDGIDSAGQVSSRPRGQGFTAVSVGARHSCAIDSNGAIHCWGSDKFGQSSPPAGYKFIALEAGDNYTCAMSADGKMECWGRFDPVAQIPPPEPTAAPTPVGSPLAAATLTPTPTAPPTPTVTPAPAHLGTRSNPVPLGQYYSPPTSPWQLKVVAVNKDAWSVIRAENMFNVPPAPGNRYVLVSIQVHNRGSAADTFSAYSLNTVGSSNVEYRGYSCGVIPNNFGSFARIFPGGVSRGNICFEVSSSDTSSLLLFGEYYDFDLTDRYYRDTLWFWNLR